jgi:putative salt-induced outer membrane protein YdiY
MWLSDWKVGSQVLDSYLGPDAPPLGLGEGEARRALTAAEHRFRFEVPPGVANALPRLADDSFVAERPVTYQRLWGQEEKTIRRHITV